MSNTTSSFINMKLGRYEIREAIGAGGMARVFKGYDTNLDREVAIKVLHDHYSFDKTFKERFEREAKLIATLNHPNIVQVFDFDFIVRDGSQIYYMVMSYIKGQTLRDVLHNYCEQETHMPLEDVLKFTLDMSSALGYAHQHGMVHRDVKPANILIDTTGKAILTDFGIARLAEGSSLTQEGLTVGTPTYMSPEQATGDTVDGRSDLYALAVIVYEMLAGETPFADDGTLSVLIKHIQDDVPRLSEKATINNPYLDQVIFKALAKKSSDRYQTAQEFSDDIKLALTGNMPEVVRDFTHPIPATSKLTVSTDGNGENGTTRVLGTFTTGIRTIVQKRHYSPLAILAIGLLVIVILLVIRVISDSNKNTTESSSPNTTQENTSVDSMTGAGAESMTGELYFTTNFNDAFAEYWATGDLDLINRRFTSEGYEIQTDQRNRAFATVFNLPSNYGDHSISLTGHLVEETASASAYGIIFRYVDDDNYNVFGVDGLGRYSIWVREAGNWRELRGETWTADPAINLSGIDNTLTVQIEGDEFVAIVNGEIVTTVTDSTIASGGVGIYIATPPTGSTHVIVSSFTVAEIASQSVESMTGDEPELSPTESESN